MKKMLLVGLMALILVSMTVAAQAGIEVGLGFARFADDSKINITADLAQQYGSLKGNPITADVIILESGNAALGSSLKLNTGNFKLSLGFAPGEKAPTFSKETWKNLMGALQYTLAETPAPVALGFLPTDPPLKEMNVGLISQRRIGAEYTLRF
jgi:hypothetical protein